MEDLTTFQITILSIALWLLFGYAGWVNWMFELFLKKWKMSIWLRLQLLGIMLIGGVLAWLLSWRSIKHYIG